MKQEDDVYDADDSADEDGDQDKIASCLEMLLSYSKQCKSVLDVGLGIIIFILVIFLVLVVNKGISKAVNYTGIGGLDTTFGFFFGFIRAYIIAVCIFSGFHIVYNHDKWPINKDQSYVFPYLEKGSNYLIKEFPNEKTYQDSKEKIEEL